MEETYQKFERMIHGIVNDTAEKFPNICREELLCEGNYLFIKAVESHDPTLSSLSTWVTVKVRGGLRNFASRGKWRQKKEGGELPEIPVKTVVNHLEILNRFEEDARTVVGIALTAPEDLSRGMLREILKDMGWVERRIRSCFREIRTVL